MTTGNGSVRYMARPPRRTPRRSLALLAVLCAAVLLPACGGDEERLTIYSGRTSDLVGPLLQQFSEETGIKIDVRYGDSTDLALLIDTEGDASPADVFFSQSAGALGYLAADNRLTDLPDGILDLVDGRFRSAEGTWVGTSGRVRVLVYNTDELDESELPASVFDLTDPRWSGLIGVAPSNASFQDFVSAMRDKEGDERASTWLEGLVVNKARTYSNNREIVDAVRRGEVQVGLVNHYYNVRAKAEDPSMPTANHFFPNKDLGSLILVAGAAILDTAGDRRADAEKFLEFLLSKSTQQYFADETEEYPLAKGVAADETLPPLDQIEAPEEDLSRLGVELEGTKRLIDASGLSAG